jgi:hypothetical protein
MTEVSFVESELGVLWQGGATFMPARRTLWAHFVGSQLGILHYNHPLFPTAGKLCFESSQQSLLRSAYLIII